ncbi:MAG: GntR family transcriptional regulator [Thermoleophilia bacterium]|nr:GntR family transcriptional regulator [Thermoleophilia bacterium]MDH4345804.1 GntR family transcriptional regulator [Thermoleophilia bacterium]MDH5333260.1 GntR family transcriptional regulator [Thermoleophilia bacterium]
MTSTAQRRPTAQHRAAEALRSAILDGELPPGQRVNQESWAERVGVSMIPLREALRALAGEGLVTYRPRRGYVVTELDLTDLEEVYALRRLLETEAIRRGVPLATDADVARLRRTADDCRAAASRGDLATRLETNRAFHAVLHGLARSQQLQRLVDLLWDSTEAYRALYYALPGEAVEADRAHDAIVRAVARRDVDAVVALQDAHRERALDRLRVALAA